MNKKILIAMSAVVLFASVAFAQTVWTPFPKTVLTFDTMVGNTNPYIESTGMEIRGILGGPHPWDLTFAQGSLRSDGTLHIRIQGLIIPANAGFGYNPAPFFQAVVSCKTLVSHNGNYYENIVTPRGDTKMIGNPTLGNAIINARINLPDTCIAPIVFVTSPAGKNPPLGFWFASTGFEPSGK